jgi:hypothetical protein
MVLNIISNKIKWYLSEISGIISSYENIAITDLETINRYNLKPGRYIKIKNIDDSKSEEKFILLPYLETYEKNLEFLQTILNQLLNSHYGNQIDNHYLDALNSIISYFNKPRSELKRIKFLDLDLDLNQDGKPSKNFQIGLPGYWLDENNISLGDIVLLRNDCPSPFIF